MPYEKVLCPYYMWGNQDPKSLRNVLQVAKSIVAAEQKFNPYSKSKHM